MVARSTLQAAEYETDRERFKGDPHDLIYFDEGSDFLYSQFRFIIGWNRSVDPAQRCRVVVGSNPPVDPEGFWVIRHWAPWLDEMHPRPAKAGELRWFTTSASGEDVEVDGPGPHLIGGESVRARSRSVIRGVMADNPFLAATNYDANLAGLPEELRRAYRDGIFSTSFRDDEFQVVPSAWIQEAQRRWSATPPGQPMTAIGLDVAHGGADWTVLAARHGAWYAPLVRRPGKECRDGGDVAALVVRERKNNCAIVVDVGGGYGGSVQMRLKDQGLPSVGFNGASRSIARTRDGQLGFVNKRAEAWWKFREELDPDQEFGSVIALPPDASIKADLAAPRWKLAAGGIQIEAKEDIKRRLGRSPDDGDAIVMAMSPGSKAAADHLRRSRQHDRPSRYTTSHASAKEMYRGAQR
jgi:hypothetical protein